MHWIVESGVVAFAEFDDSAGGWFARLEGSVARLIAWTEQRCWLRGLRVCWVTCHGHFEIELLIERVFFKKRQQLHDPAVIGAGFEIDTLQIIPLKLEHVVGRGKGACRGELIVS